MAAYPIHVNIQYSTDVPEYTECVVENLSRQHLRLDDKTIWEGTSGSKQNFPREIPAQEKVPFKHEASGGPIIGSVGALEYVLGERSNLKWIIAWSNSKNELNKVYTEIIEDDAVNRDDIKVSLHKSGQRSVHDSDNYPVSSAIEIDPTSAKPTVKATPKLRE